MTTNGKKLKVLHLADNLTCGGKERRLVSLLNNLKDNINLDISLALIDDDVFYKDHLPAGFKYYTLDRKFKRDPLVFIKLYRLLKKLKPDIVHSWGSMPSIYAIPAIKKLGIKFINAEVANAPNSLSPAMKFRSKLAFRYSDLILSNSWQGLTSYNCPEEKSMCIHNGFDFDRISDLADPEEVRARFNIKTPKVIGMVGAILPKKDYVTYLIAAMEITKRYKDVTFLVVGDGEKLEFYKKMTQGFDRIIYTGKQDNVESIVNIFDVGVLCTNSNIHGEGISNSIMEYMALGKPVIATNGGGTAEIVKDGVNGYLCESRNPDQLYEKLTALIEDPQLASTLGQNGLLTIQESFSMEQMTRKTLEVYSRFSGRNLIDSENFIPIGVPQKKIIQKEAQT